MLKEVHINTFNRGKFFISPIYLILFVGKDKVYQWHLLDGVIKREINSEPKIYIEK